MLLTLTTTHQPATDLGYLLHKHPDRAQAFEIAAGTAHVFYPAATDDECTAALLIDIDPIALVRGKGRDRGFALAQYVNDRPYAAGSMLAVALGKVFRTAMGGRCKERPELVDTVLPLRVDIPALPCRGGTRVLERLFGPLGWRIDASPVPLDPAFPEWGDSRYVTVRLSTTARLAEALRQLYVLLPVLDGVKHYWISEDEIDKLLRAGEGWLSEHPERELITTRYLKHRKGFVHSALARLADADGVDAEELDNALDEPAVAPERQEPLTALRRRAVVSALREAGAARVLDLGCGGGALLADLLAEPSFTEILGVDVSARALEVAERSLHLDRLSDRVRERITLRQSALTYADPSLAGFDAAVLMEVIEHVDESRLGALEHSVFAVARPATVLVTTPNSEYNVRFESLPAGHFRHSDHRFEWTRAQFHEWAETVAAQHDYAVRYTGVGPDDAEVGTPTQMAVFTRKES
ncbi:3' terminal RNA ribose 2'-O-methyltransferase Hen1 [Herbihabitans rhizosphaerae]|uniref:Small RNA 2'-O-methyltransferase n=1 Tax=Herbihabitans rhizosphaerae TaxID=1872711 RepID=A0A4V2EUF7_9PSEU|nr:3' terminal RNA ribose 2'-O-methyltransferase Hen1 [Herbihabitans rhizosphaerae]RZS44413.1 3' terminal RNA ribose 2'-O-methyltransferase Hen1 [Herbihabitans rhizosphaerae]